MLTDAHHRFQWIHPFQDTNGRTGRVLDHFILWSCFGLRGDAPETSPNLVYEPSNDAMRKAYFDGLADADNHRPDKLRAYYAGRVRFSISDL